MAHTGKEGQRDHLDCLRRSGHIRAFGRAYQFNRIGELIVEQMDVRVERERRSMMAEKPLDPFRILASLEEQRSRRVSERVR